MLETLGFSNRGTPCFLRLAGRGKRPGSLWIQRSLRCGSSRGSGCFGSGCFRGFLCSRLFRSFLGSRFFRYFLRSGFLCWCFLSSSFFGRGFFGDDFLCWCFFRRGFLRRYFFGRCFFRRRFFSDYFFCRGFLRRYFFCRCFLWSSFFCRRFFRSCHSFLLDHVAKSTSRLEYAKRFAALGQRKTGPSAANTGAKTNAHSSVVLLGLAILEIMLFLLGCLYQLHISPRTGRHPTGIQSRGSQKSCVPSSGQSFRSSTGTDFPRWGTGFPGQSVWRGDWRCNAGSL